MSFHAIGQIGYMFLGIGLGLYFLPVNPALATIALVAGLFHMVNHSWFKSCLFLNAGSIFYKTGTRDLNKIGGLFSLMPWTGITAIIASLSIAGIPPFNGFACKLLIFESSIIAGTEAGAAIWAKALFVILGHCRYLYLRSHVGFLPQIPQFCLYGEASRGKGKLKGRCPAVNECPSRHSGIPVCAFWSCSTPAHRLDI